MAGDRVTETQQPQTDRRAPSARLVTQDIAFHGIPDFESALMPVEVEVPTASLATLEVVVPPLAPFSVNRSPVASNRPSTVDGAVPEGPDPRRRTRLRIWVRYDSTGPCTTDRGSLTVGLAETGERWTVELTGSTVPAASLS